MLCDAKDSPIKLFVLAGHRNMEGERAFVGALSGPRMAPLRKDDGKIAFIGNYVPRRCGIATFTTDLRCAVAACDISLAALKVAAENGRRLDARVQFVAGDISTCFAARSYWSQG